MAQASMILKGAGSHMQSGASLMHGIGQEMAAKFEAKQMMRNAKSIEALGQQEAAAERLKGEELASAARARMAAGGMGMDSKMIGDIREKADYNALVALHNRYTEADIMQDQAKALKQQGKQAMRESRLAAVGSMVSMAGSALSEYGASRGSKPADTSMSKETPMGSDGLSASNYYGPR